MNLIDRHILKLFIGYLLGGILVFVTLFMAVNFLSVALVHYRDASTGTLLRFYGYQIPGAIYQLAPVACLMATLFTFSSLHRSNELVALFSSGISLSRLAAPVLILVGLIGGFLFFMGDQILPRFTQKKNYVQYVELEKKPGLYSTVKTNRIWYRSENILFNIKTLNPKAAKAQGITLYYFDNDWNLVQLVSADSVDMRGHEWELNQGYVTLFATESSFPLTKSFASKIISMNEDLGDIQTSSNSSDVMTMRELSRFIDHNKEAGLDTIHYEVDYHAKFGFAFATLVMALLGVPFSIHRTRSGGAMVNLGICLGLAFGYWTLYSSCITLGQHGTVPPLVAAWTANLLMGGLSLILVRRLKF
jgi:lipopolysaccharide export system permease protein